MQNIAIYLNENITYTESFITRSMPWKYSLLTSWTRISNEGTHGTSKPCICQNKLTRITILPNTKNEIYQTHSYVLLKNNMPNINIIKIS